MTPEIALEIINNRMSNEDYSGSFYSDIGWGGSTPETMFELYQEGFRDALQLLLKKQNTFTFTFAAPCPLDGWVLCVKHKEK